MFHIQFLVTAITHSGCITEKKDGLVIAIWLQCHKKFQFVIARWLQCHKRVSICNHYLVARKCPIAQSPCVPCWIWCGHHTQRRPFLSFWDKIWFIYIPVSCFTSVSKLILWQGCPLPKLFEPGLISMSHPRLPFYVKIDYLKSHLNLDGRLIAET